MLGGPHRVFLTLGRLSGASRLLSFDTQARTLAWQVRGKFPGNPVYAGGVLYAAQSAPFRVEARDPATGSILWTWVEPQSLRSGFRSTDIQEIAPGGDIVVTDSHLFVSSHSRVYAIDLRTHGLAWNYSRPGRLAISARGVLYIATGWWDGDGQLVAINLK